MRILIVGEGVGSADMTDALRSDGYVVDVVRALGLARESVMLVEYRMVVLGSQTLNSDGANLLRFLTDRSPATGIVALVPAGDAANRIALLDAGADDCIPDTSGADEIIARLRAVMRRLPRAGYAQSVKVGAVTYRPGTHEISIAGAPVVLPRRELAIFDALVRRAEGVVPRGCLEEAAYGFDDEIESNAISSHVSRLRRRLTGVGAGVSIRPVRGVGYSLQVTRGVTDRSAVA